MSVTKLLVILIVLGGAGYFVYHMGWIGKAQQGIDESFDAHFAKAQGLWTSMKYDEAITEYDKALSLDPKNSDAPTATMRKAECLKELKRVDEAKATYEKLLADYPNANSKLRDQVTKALQKITLGS